MIRALITLLLFANINSTVTNTDNIEAKNNVFIKDKQEETISDLSLININKIPKKKQNIKEINIEAKAALVMDLDTGIILYSKNPESKLAMASLTKIMTAIIILENHDMNEIVVVKDDYNQVSNLGVRVWLQQYEKITVGDLLKATLIPSAGDAVMALAKYHSGSVEAFVDEMNKRAKELNLKNTHFINPIGIDADNHYSDVFDLAILSKYALNFPEFRKIIKLKSATIHAINSNISHELKNTNKLLDTNIDVRGIKTGTTDNAGESLINLAYNKNKDGIIVVLLNSPNRFKEARNLIEWTFNSFDW